MRTEMKILGGLPVTIEFTICPAEPDVGIFSEYVDEWEVVEINSKPCKKAPGWLYSRIDKTEGEEVSILAGCLNALNGAREDALEYAYDFD